MLHLRMEPESQVCTLGDKGGWEMFLGIYISKVEFTMWRTINVERVFEQFLLQRVLWMW